MMAYRGVECIEIKNKIAGAVEIKRKAFNEILELGENKAILTYDVAVGSYKEFLRKVIRAMREPASKELGGYELTDALNEQKELNAFMQWCEERRKKFNSIDLSSIDENSLSTLGYIRYQGDWYVTEFGGWGDMMMFNANVGEYLKEEYLEWKKCGGGLT